MAKLKSLSFFAAVVLLAAGFVYFALAWTDPTQPPPGGNVPAPVNVGSTDQSKAGSLGVGMTAAPQRTLHISGGNILLDNTRTLEAKNAAGGIESWMWPRWDDDVMYANFGSGGWNIRNNSSLSVMFMTASGDIAIGVTTPSAGLKLDVEGKVGATEYCDQNGANCKTIASLSGGSLWTASGNNIFNTNTGNVGIGTASPGALLDIKQVAANADHNLLKLTESSWSGSPGKHKNIIWSDGSGTIAAIGAQYNDVGDDLGSIDFHSIYNGGYKTDSDILMRIKGNGNVGIGTTNPGGKLEVRSSAAATYIFTDSSTSGYITTFNMDNTGLDIGHNSASRALYLKTAGADRLTILGGGNVGIGTTAPTAKLEVTGDIKANGNLTMAGNIVPSGGSRNLGASGNAWSKLYVGTIDPVYEIDGKKYATYVSDFAGGVRTETSGVLQLQTTNYKLPTNIIDFDELEKGSDLWLFWKTSNKNIGDLVVILTPGFDGKTWYEKQDNKLIIYGDKASEVSYRLTLPRKDYEEWGNLIDENE